MRPIFSAMPYLLLAGLALGADGAGAEPAGAGVGLAVADFAYVDTSGEPGAQEVVHRERLSAFMAALRRDLAADGRIHLTPALCATAPCGDGRPPAADLRRAAASAGAGLLVTGGIHKMSTLVQWAQVQVVDLEAERVVLDRLFTYRGDNDQAWVRAETFIARDILEALSGEGGVGND